MRTSIWWCFFGVFVFGTGQAHAASRVILISVDGLRFDAIEAAYTPTLDALIEQGSYAPWTINELPASTLPNHTTMLTGLAVAEHQVRFDWSVEGTVPFRTLHDECADVGLTTGFLSAKNKMSYLAHAESIDVLEIGSSLEALVDTLVARIATDPLDFVFLHSNQPDSTGHVSGWMSPEYLDAVAAVDVQIGRIIEALAAAGLEDVDILVTADHGGLGMLHFRNIPEDRLVPWIAWGPDIAAGRTICTQVMQADTPATVLALLGLPIPDSYSGRPVSEALASATAEDCQPMFPFLGLPCIFLMVPLWLLAWAKMATDRRRMPRSRVRVGAVDTDPVRSPR
jgi:hypothetical protein